MEISDHLSRMFRALAHPQRLALFERVRSAGVDCSKDGTGQACVRDVAEGVGLSPPTVSHHLKELKEAGLIRCERRGKRVFCTVDPQALREIQMFTRSSVAGGARGRSRR